MYHRVQALSETLAQYTSLTDPVHACGQRFLSAVARCASHDNDALVMSLHFRFDVNCDAAILHVFMQCRF